MGQSWKRGERDNRNNFRAPKVADDDDWSDKRIRDGENALKFFNALFGFFFLTCIYTVGFYFGLTALGLESLQYSDAVIVSASFVAIRYVDQVVIDKSKNQ